MQTPLNTNSLSSEICDEIVNNFDLIFILFQQSTLPASHSRSDISLLSQGESSIKGLGLRGHEKGIFSFSPVIKKLMRISMSFLLISANYRPPLPWSLEKSHSNIIICSISGASVRASARGRSTAPSSELAAQVSKSSTNGQQMVSKWSTNSQRMVRVS